MPVGQELITWLVGQIVVGAAIWGGIRADMRGMLARVEAAQKSADAAHERLDRHLEKG